MANPGTNVVSSQYQPYYRPGNFKYSVTVDNAEIGFSKVSGLSNGRDLLEYREGNEPEISHKFPGLTKTDNITLERAVSPKTSDHAKFFLDWDASVLDVTVGHGVGTSNVQFRKTLRVDLRDHLNNIVTTWYCYNCWPTKVSWTDLDANGNEVSRETVELACEYVQRVYG